MPTETSEKRKIFCVFTWANETGEGVIFGNAVVESAPIKTIEQISEITRWFERNNDLYYRSCCCIFYKEMEI